MTLQELSNIELSLQSKVVDLSNQKNGGNWKNLLSDIFEKYRHIHQTYSDICEFDSEALKRALFIQWYQISEPSWLTGINELNEHAQNHVIEILNQKVIINQLDYELIWMLNYYSNWSFIFDKYSAFKGFDITIVNEENNKLPDNIDKDAMKSRGQMGKYWNSLSKFSKIH